MSPLAQALLDAGCVVAVEWEDDWTAAGAAVGFNAEGHWAFVESFDEGTCPGCACEEVGDVFWCDETEARDLLAKRTTS